MSWNSKNHERMKSDPEARDLSNPKQVWEDGEMTPVPSTRATRTGMLGRVADAGDLADGNPTPYELDIQAEILSQTNEPTRPEAGAPVSETSAER